MMTTPSAMQSIFMLLYPLFVDFFQIGMDKIMQCFIGCIQKATVMHMLKIAVLYGFGYSIASVIIWEEHINILIIVCINYHWYEVSYIRHNETVAVFRKIQKMFLLDGEISKIIRKLPK